MVKAWVDKEYEDGRMTVITDDEMTAVIAESCKKLNLDLVGGSVVSSNL